MHVTGWAVAKYTVKQAIWHGTKRLSWSLLLGWLIILLITCSAFTRARSPLNVTTRAVLGNSFEKISWHHTKSMLSRTAKTFYWFD